MSIIFLGGIFITQGRTQRIPCQHHTRSCGEKAFLGGEWIGKIQTLGDFLEMVPSPSAVLDPLSVVELAAMHQGLHREYERRFKRR